MTVETLYRWFDKTITDLLRQVRWSYLPPLMVYFAAGLGVSDWTPQFHYWRRPERLDGGGENIRD